MVKPNKTHILSAGLLVGLVLLFSPFFHRWFYPLMSAEFVFWLMGLMAFCFIRQQFLPYRQFFIAYIAILGLSSLTQGFVTGDSLHALAGLWLWVWIIASFAVIPDVIQNVAKLSPYFIATFATFEWSQGNQEYRDHLGWFGHVSFAGHILAINALLALWQIIESKSRKDWVLPAAAFTVLVFQLDESGARSALVLLLGITAFWIIKKPKFKILIALSCIGIGLSFSNTAFKHRSLRHETAVSRISRAVETKESFTSHSQLRKKILAESLALGLEKPILGHGADSFRFHYFKVDEAQGFQHRRPYEWLMHPHQELLNQFVQGGVWGFVSFLLLLGIFFKASLTKIPWALPVFAFIVLDWQLSTCFLHPGSRLYFAFAVAGGLGYSRISPLTRWSAVVPIFYLAIVFTGSFFLNQVAQTLDPEKKLSDSKTASMLLLQNFDSLFTKVQIHNRYQNDADNLNDAVTLAHRYPNVPIAQTEAAASAIGNREFDEAKTWVNQALLINPELEEAKRLLKILEAR